ncbi:hypothetical protein M378DRAFT_76308 [Amanita muscaria Koide BX008]|uniref:GAF domain-like protein n=1 Tax=Amanita muscaria (strain Koide BX008) TaxID=946122 RepID=A0A0C2SRD6_AMAMK|nr:hypothetical protein M378DRAFT_76308 [Amanita muscaria Koide BX008]
MPHADASLVPASIQTKAEFWQHVYSQLEAMLGGGERHWVSNLSNASSLLYHSLLSFPVHFGSDGSKAVNWCGDNLGFYIHSQYFPRPLIQAAGEIRVDAERLLLGPFCGKPACQFINVAPGKARGVCADAYMQRKTTVVPNVGLYPGHIACDSETKSEIVCPLVLNSGDSVIALGVLDLDCLAEGGFDNDDRVGLERIASLVVKACDW